MTPSAFQSELAESGNRIELSIIIVTWNGKQFVWECLESLRAYQGDHTVEIIVIDNASSDGTPELIEAEFPEVHLIRNSVNLGFARANNIGIVSSSGRYMALVNSDVKVSRDCLRSLHAYLEINHSVGMIGPKMVCPNGLIGRSCMRFPTVLRGFCDALGLHRIARNSGRLSILSAAEFDENQAAQVDVLNGWFLMVRRQAVEDVGLLDEQFFMYGEDIDWSYRFHKAGWKRVYFGGASAFHFGGGSSAVAPIRFYIEMRRANLQLSKKHHGTVGYFLYLAITLLHEIVRVVGNGILGFVKGSERSTAMQKVQRSLASIRWLFNHNRQDGVAAP